MVQTIWRTILRFFTDFLMRCKFQPELCCAGCTQTCLSTRGWKPWQWMPGLCHVLTYLLVFIHLVPQITLTLPQVTNEAISSEARGWKHSRHQPFIAVTVFSSSIGQLLGINQSDTRLVELRPRACRMKRFGPQTQLRRSLLNCPNQVRKVKVRPLKNELSLPNFFRFAEHPELGLWSKSSSNEDRALQEAALCSMEFSSLTQNPLFSSFFFSASSESQHSKSVPWWQSAGSLLNCLSQCGSWRGPQILLYLFNVLKDTVLVSAALT